MSMSVSMAKSTTKTNIKHNNRTMSDKEKERNPHIDSERSHENKYLVQKYLKELYQDEFGESLEKYNDKQKRSDRKIDDYYKHIQLTKKTSLQQEMIIQVGDRGDFSSNENREDANAILEEWFLDFEERNPNLKVYNAVIHNDEASPHLHLNFVPVASGYQRGLEKQVAFDRAIIQQDQTLNKTRPFEDWRENEVNLLAEKLKVRGIERKIVGTNQYKDVNAYKEKKDLEKEIKELEQSLSQKKIELSALNGKIPYEIKVPEKRQIKNVEVPTGEKTMFGKEKTKTEKKATGNVILSEQDYKKIMTAAMQKEQVTKKIDKILNTDYAKENKYLRTSNKELEEINNKNVAKRFKLNLENSKLKDKISDLTNEIESVYQTTKDFLKERTDDLQTFKRVIGDWVDRVKEKLSKSEIRRLHDRSEVKEVKFDMNSVKELDKQAKRQKTVRKGKDMDLER